MSTHHHRSEHVSLMHKLKDKLLGHKDERHSSEHHAVTTAAVPLFNPPVVAHPVEQSEPHVTAHPVGGCAATGGFASRGVKRDKNKSDSSGRRSTSHTNEETKPDHHSTSDEKSASMTRDSHESHHDNRRASTNEQKVVAETLSQSEKVLDRNDSTHMTLHEEQLAVSKQQVSAGEVDIHKRVKEEYVERSVPVAHEEIVVERRPYSGPDSDRTPEKDEVARVLLYREEVVTTKRLVPTEEVVVTKNEVVDQHTVEATLRSEFVETTVRANEGTAHTSEKIEPVNSGSQLKAARG